ncbi:unnamed protein product [Soboliphyme baturini]|uniref:triacylglycerol lipase n=1 Tax=Soboliphyme baturini TaxID=241478 RepID=A0A183IH16_9BILA|nr:unnamed protein product [Soboliphyme baturini]
MNISFSGCGFLGIYHIGVASAIKEYAPDICGKLCGASAGAIAASALLCDCLGKSRHNILLYYCCFQMLGQAVTYVCHGSELISVLFIPFFNFCCLDHVSSRFLSVAIEARSRALGPLHPSFDLVKIVRDGLTKGLPENAHKLATGRLFVSLTRLSDGANVLASEFDTKEELIEAIICSMFIPLYSGAIPPCYKGTHFIDGGWSNNLPVLDENTVTVSPFSGEADICPLDSDSSFLMSFDIKNTNIRFTCENFHRLSVALLPPHPEVLSKMCRQGFQDALRFLTKNSKWFFHT